MNLNTGFLISILHIKLLINPKVGANGLQLSKLYQNVHIQIYIHTCRHVHLYKDGSIKKFHQQETCTKQNHKPNKTCPL